MREGEVVAYKADHLLTLAWQAKKKKKLVIMLSTTCAAAMTVLTPHSRKPPVFKPAIVDCYSHFMNEWILLTNIQWKCIIITDLFEKL